MQITTNSTANGENTCETADTVELIDVYFLSMTTGLPITTGKNKFNPGIEG